MIPLNEEISELLEKAKINAIKFLSYRPRSEKEVKDFLFKKKFSENIISQTLNFLKEHKLVDDIEFAKWWIEQRQEFKAKSKFIIKQELLFKGVAKEVIENILEKSLGDFEVALALFEKNMRKFKNYKGQELFNKAASFLQRKGFKWEVIEKILKKCKIERS
ncbi:MAG: hypothetical protein A2857_03925 [Candidatus Levybacteria bacterium RIFCSPHIGHO2_01_FULL_36_15]|nr:MAG: hypothetical protein A2857_03925 [Candidatus Levybacteria bacterium RIFCSPHIGHO2_01_FULL_36_15]OGH38529.1 MAG: hypothetical protein A2905_02750 [Candidatus Levybacteria bacterium RIFCSPLOWO2_01_FULL_36_10]